MGGYQPVTIAQLQGTPVFLRPENFFPGYGFTGASALALQEAFPAAGKKPAPRLLSAGLALLQDRI